MMPERRVAGEVVGGDDGVVVVVVVVVADDLARGESKWKRRLLSGVHDTKGLAFFYLTISC